MAAKDKFHEVVRVALEKEGWTITDDPYILQTKPRQNIDFGAERIIGAERGSEKIAVEVKSFLNASQLYDFYAALGQYISYEVGLSLQEPERTLYLAMPQKAFETLMKFDTIPLTIERQKLKILVFNPFSETFVQWLN